MKYFFNVKITGMIFSDGFFLLNPLLRFRGNQHWHLEDFEIEITYKFLSTGYGAGSNWGYLSENSVLDIRGLMIYLNLKVFDESFQ